MAMALDDTEAKRTIWARTAAQHLVDGVLTAIERYPAGDRNMLLREIARQAVWHMQDLSDEVRRLARYLDVENLRQPHPFDDEPPGG